MELSKRWALVGLGKVEDGAKLMGRWSFARARGAGLTGRVVPEKVVFVGLNALRRCLEFASWRPVNPPITQRRL
jgi:hypothetical protein